jgi:hypothetical protein
VVYAARPGVVAITRQTGQLPPTIATGGANIADNLIIRRRGRDFTLNEDEQLVYDAILREGRLPGGGVTLIPQKSSGDSDEQEQ